MVDPIFITSLMRTNSTYWWTKFREAPSCLAFYEFIGAGTEPGSDPKNLRHPEMKKDRFAEYHENGLEPIVWRDHVSYLAPGETNSSLEGIISSQLSAANSHGKRTVLKSTSCELLQPWLKEKYGGTHIYLHRDLGSIIRSFNSWRGIVSPYYRMMAAEIGNQANHPLFRDIAKHLRIPNQRFGSQEEEDRHYSKLLLSQENREFYKTHKADLVGFFWVVGAVLAAKHADVIIDNEALRDKSACEAIINNVQEITGVDFDASDYKYKPAPAITPKLSDCGKAAIRSAINHLGIEQDELPQLLEKFSVASKSQLADALGVDLPKQARGF